jgi:hypothetical protein
MPATVRAVYSTDTDYGFVIPKGSYNQMEIDNFGVLFLGTKPASASANISDVATIAVYCERLTSPMGLGEANYKNIDQVLAAMKRNFPGFFHLGK